MTEIKMETKGDLFLKDLDSFSGTEQYYNIMGYRITDGVKYLMDNGYSWVVTDAIAILKLKLPKEEFVSIKLVVTNDTARLLYTDGNATVLYEQEYEWTNAKRNLDLFATDNVLLLAGEY